MDFQGLPFWAIVKILLEARAVGSDGCGPPARCGLRPEVPCSPPSRPCPGFCWPFRVPMQNHVRNGPPDRFGVNERERPEKKREEYTPLLPLCVTSHAWTSGRPCTRSLLEGGCVLPSSKFSSYLRCLFITPAFANSLHVTALELGRLGGGNFIYQ